MLSLSDICEEEEEEEDDDDDEDERGNMEQTGSDKNACFVLTESVKGRSNGGYGGGGDGSDEMTRLLQGKGDRSSYPSGGDICSRKGNRGIDFEKGASKCGRALHHLKYHNKSPQNHRRDCCKDRNEGVNGCDRSNIQRHALGELYSNGVATSRNKTVYSTNNVYIYKVNSNVNNKGNRRHLCRNGKTEDVSLIDDEKDSGSATSLNGVVDRSRVNQSEDKRINDNLCLSSPQSLESIPFPPPPSSISSSSPSASSSICDERKHQSTLIQQQSPVIKTGNYSSSSLISSSLSPSSPSYPPCQIHIAKAVKDPESNSTSKDPNAETSYTDNDQSFAKVMSCPSRTSNQQHGLLFPNGEDNNPVDDGKKDSARRPDSPNANRSNSISVEYRRIIYLDGIMEKTPSAVCVLAGGEFDVNQKRPIEIPIEKLQQKQHQYQEKAEEPRYNDDCTSVMTPGSKTTDVITRYKCGSSNVLGTPSSPTPTIGTSSATSGDCLSTSTSTSSQLLSPLANQNSSGKHHFHDGNDVMRSPDRRHQYQTLIPIHEVKRGLARKQIIQLSVMTAIGFVFVAIIILWLMSPVLFS